MRRCSGCWGALLRPGLRWGALWRRCGGSGGCWGHELRSRYHGGLVVGTPNAPLRHSRTRDTSPAGSGGGAGVMMQRTAVILVVGLNESLLAYAPRLSAFAKANTVRRLRPPLPAVTCTAQSSMLTGRAVSSHGVVGNGWYNREQGEVQFWKQSNRLV